MHRSSTSPNGLLQGILAFLLFAAVGWAGLNPAPLRAQVVQRSFVNPSFETPRIGNNPNGCTRTIWAGLVPGWSTTESSGVPFSGISPEDCYAVAPYPPNPTAGQVDVIQLFLENYQGSLGYSETAARDLTPTENGVQFAELNAQTAARLYQQVCMINGEKVDWKLSHRARRYPDQPDVMEFNIGPDPRGSLGTPAAVRIVRAATTATGIQGSTSTPRACGTSASLQSATCSWTDPNIATTNTAGGWADYSGSFIWQGGSSLQTIGFEAISSTWGIAGGNYLDAITVTLKPFVQFYSATSPATTTFTRNESNTTTHMAQIQLVGTVVSSFSLPLTVTGTASSGSDYSLTSSISIPAGDYGTGTLIDIPITFLNDSVIEDNETLILTIPSGNSSSPYVVANTNSCNGSTNSQITFNIIDNDIDLVTTKSVSPDAMPAHNSTFNYTVSYSNRTGATTALFTTSHDVTAAISDPVPSGLTFNSWTCAASGAAGTACPAASGSGAISGSAVLPAGGTITYTVIAAVAGPTCAAIQNTATITTPSGFTEATAVQSGFSSPASPGGTGNNTASVSVTPQCTDLRITKSSVPAIAGPGQPSDTAAVGQNITYTLLVENIGIAVTGAVVTDQPISSITCPAPAPASSLVSCTASAGSSACTSATYPLTTLTGSGIVLGTMPANSTATLTFVCQAN